MPSYILGYLTIATAGRTGPIQDQWREWFGRDAWFPDVESLGGAIITFSLVLYPYVYLLARAALRDQASGAYLTARSLGAGPARIDAASRAPARPTGDRRRCRRGDDGNAHRLRDRAVLRCRHRVGRRLPDLARHLRPRRGQRARARRARVRACSPSGSNASVAGAPGSDSPAARTAEWSPTRLTGRSGGRRDRHVRARDLRRLRRPDPAADRLGDRRTAQPPGHAAARPVPRVPVEQPATRRHHRVRLPDPRDAARQRTPIRPTERDQARHEDDGTRLRRSRPGRRDRGAARPSSPSTRASKGSASISPVPSRPGRCSCCSTRTWCASSLPGSPRSKRAPSRSPTT